MGCSSIIEIQFAMIIFPVLSVLACVIVIAVCLRGKILDDVTSRIVVYMSINDLIRSLGMFFLMGIDGTGISCKFWGYVITFTAVSNVIWALSISITLYQVLVLEITDYRKYHRAWFIIAFPACATFQAMPFITDSYGKNGKVCNLVPNKLGNIWGIVVLWAPLWVFIIAFLVIFCLMYKKIGKESHNFLSDLVLKRGFVYPFIAFVMILPLCVAMLGVIATGSCSAQLAMLITEGLYSGHGFANAVAFFLNKNVRKALNFKLRGEVSDSFTENITLYLK